MSFAHGGHRSPAFHEPWGAGAGRSRHLKGGRTGFAKGSEREVSEVKMKKGEPVDRALRRLKKKVDREGTLKEVRNHRHFEKPSEKRRRQMKVAKFNAMLAARYADV